MVATITARVYTGAGATTESTAQTGVSFLSIDSALTDATTRSNNPVVTGTSSFEKHIRLKVDVAPTTSVTNFKVWCATAAQANVALRMKIIGTGGASPGTGDATPVATTLTTDVDVYAYASQGAAYTWDTAAYTTLNNVTKALIMQLQPNASATPGAWTTTTISYAYDES